MPKLAKQLTAIEVKRLTRVGFHAVGTVLAGLEALDTKTSLASLPSCSKLHFVVEFTITY